MPKTPILPFFDRIDGFDILVCIFSFLALFQERTTTKLQAASSSHNQPELGLGCNRGS